MEIARVRMEANQRRRTRILGTAVLAVVVGALGGCGSSRRIEAVTPENRVPLPELVMPGPEDWRPEWWLPVPERAPGTASVTTMSTSRDLLSARREALASARSAFLVVTGQAPARSSTQADSVRLPDGRFRAFVRLNGQLPEPTEASVRAEEAAGSVAR